MNTAVAADATATITLQPVRPQGVVPAGYPDHYAIDGTTVTLDSVPARVWMQVRFRGWAPLNATTIQASVELGGFSGGTANCGGLPGNADDLTLADVPCTSNTECRSWLRADQNPCGAGEPSRCMSFPELGPGNHCEFTFQDRCNPNWALSGLAGVAATDHCENGTRCRFGVQTEPPDFIADYGWAIYLGTLVIDVPEGALGTYTISFNRDETFMYDDTTWPGPCDPFFCPIHMVSAVINVTCGRCCYALGTGDAQCQDGVTPGECAAQPTSHVFHADMLCPQNGGPECPDCGSDADCDDGLFCNGLESCTTEGTCLPGQAPCGEDERCHEEADYCFPAAIPTVSAWGLAILTLLLLTAAKLQYGRTFSEPRP